jgi:hypothetical protein
VAYDDISLYLAFECNVDDVKSLAAGKLRPDDSDIYEGEVVEVLLNCKADPENYWHLTVNPANSRWDGIRGSPVLNLIWTSATGRGDRKWTVEIALPFASLGIATPAGNNWRVNLCRESAPRKDGEREFSAWNSVKSGFLDSDCLGVWFFGEQ